MAFNAGEILGFLRLDKSGFSSGILEAQGLTSLLGNTISSFLGNPLVGVANIAKQAVSGIIDLVTTTANAADEFSKLSQATGASVEFLSGLKYAGDLSGAGMDQITASINRLVKGMGEVAEGKSGPAVEALRAMGVSAADSGGQLRNVQDVYLDVADALAKIENPSQRAALAQQVFGEQAGKLLPLLGQGRAGIEGMIAEADKLGLTFDANAGKAAERFNDSLSRIKSALMGVGIAAAVPLFESFAPVLENLAGTLADTLGPVLGMVGEMFAQLAPVIGQHVQTLGENLIPLVGSLAGVFESLMPAIGPVFELMGSLSGLVINVLAPALELLTPILRVIAELVGAVANGISGLVDAISSPFKSAVDALGLGGGSKDQSDPTAAPVVNVTVSPEDSARRVADKIAPQVSSAVRSVQYGVEQSVQRRASVASWEQSLVLR